MPLLTRPLMPYTQGLLRLRAPLADGRAPGPSPRRHRRQRARSRRTRRPAVPSTPLPHAVPARANARPPARARRRRPPRPLRTLARARHAWPARAMSAADPRCARRSRHVPGRRGACSAAQAPSEGRRRRLVLHPQGRGAWPGWRVRLRQDDGRPHHPAAARADAGAASSSAARTSPSLDGGACARSAARCS